MPAMNKTHTVGLILLGILAASSAIAESEDGQTSRPLQKLQSELKLNEQQTRDVKQIFDDTKPELEALRKQVQAVMEKRQQRLKAVLTAEQWEKFEQLKQERRDNRRQRRFGPAN
jgi:Spy/CpxP family protein refolding chaperone